MRRYWKSAIKQTEAPQYKSKEHDAYDPTETGLPLKSEHKIKLSQQNASTKKAGVHENQSDKTIKEQVSITQRQRQEADENEEEMPS